MKVKNNCNTTSQCRNGCGFYGSPQYNGYCSKCYKLVTFESTEAEQSNVKVVAPAQDNGIRNDDAGPVKPPELYIVHSTRKNSDRVVVVNTKPVETISFDPNPYELSDANSEIQFTPPVPILRFASNSSLPADTSGTTSQGTVNRCHVCRKRVGLTGMTCRCGNTFCAFHRYTDRHDCPVDYQTLGQEELRRDNPPVRGEKIRKI